MFTFRNKPKQQKEDIWLSCIRLFEISCCK